MSKIKIKLAIVVIGLIVVVMGATTWFYPQSILSVKDYAYTPDRGEVAGLSEDLEQLKALIEADDMEDTASKQSEPLLRLYEMEWLTSTDPVRMDDIMLNHIELLLGSAREQVTALLVRENYDEPTKEWLTLTNYGIIDAEKRASKLGQSNWTSRKELDYEYRTMYQSIANSLDRFMTFYERRSSLELEQ